MCSPRFIALLIAVLVFATFSPTLDHGFLDWDDVANLVANQSYRGLDWAHLHWMLTTLHGGHWAPLVWLSFGTDYIVWGMAPIGYHLTNVALHSLNAVIFFYLSRRLLRLARPESSPRAVNFGAAAAALFFALHPLRVESVAWITERRDVLSALFWLGAIIAYLRASERDGKVAARWRAASVGSYQLAIMAKSIAVTLPIVLLILDVFPLRRRAQGHRPILLEKLPYLPMTVFGIWLAIYAVRVTGFWTSNDHLPTLMRVALAAYSGWFYVSATWVPIGLSPLYELPPNVGAFEARFVLSFVAVGVITLLMIRMRRRWPAGLACWAAYLIIVAPVSGILHNGPQLVADRYSYLSCLPWALGFGGLVSLSCERIAGSFDHAMVHRVSATVCLVALSILPVLTLRQLPVWHDSATLWTSTLAADPNCSVCHYNLGQYFRNQGHAELAVTEFSRAAELRPAFRNAAVYRANRGLAYLALGKIDIADEEFAALQVASPSFAEDVRPAFISGW